MWTLGRVMDGWSALCHWMDPCAFLRTFEPVKQKLTVKSQSVVFSCHGALHSYYHEIFFSLSLLNYACMDLPGKTCRLSLVVLI